MEIPECYFYRIYNYTDFKEVGIIFEFVTYDNNQLTMLVKVLHGPYISASLLSVGGQTCPNMVVNGEGLMVGFLKESGH